MLLPNRHGSSNEYRYGFQGQEKDDEIKGEGNSLNYTFRMHDPRVGRFFAVDPLSKNYAHYSPYMFSGNKVIAFGELEGLEEIIKTTSFNNLTKPVMQVIYCNEVLNGYYESISQEDKQEVQIVYMTTFIGGNALEGRGQADAFTVNLSTYVERALKAKDELVHKRTNKKQKQRKTDLRRALSIFIENGLNLDDIVEQINSGKEVFLIAINEDKVPSDTSKILELTDSLIHEIDAKDHLRDQLNGVESKDDSGAHGHTDYFDLIKYPSGLSKEEIEAGYSPNSEDINPKSKAGKNRTLIKETIEKNGIK